MCNELNRNCSKLAVISIFCIRKPHLIRLGGVSNSIRCGAVLADELNSYWIERKFTD
ncbi:5'-nucleotidase SurE [Neisseria shayeganii 871]|uniref:5'-nucleotidase SurE n=1 Tax=Neisseria shayeganii 871 TaxID=1032488 RepID=G4CEH6_9NEIS|nr:5'-nucleotidase SurE [Neisseria shayeganii 871]